MKLFTKIFSKPKTIKVDFCEKNLDRFLSEEHATDYHSFLSNKNVHYKEYSCQSKCKECQQSPYAIVNGEFMAAESSRELLEKLKEHQETKS
ncbi:DUF1450 domain-containing protein [Mesobacillus foraminis]|uniref:Uncharacterized protein YuzB (UPF0349 family) n=1 Tax=Mesobacillus foraminis TaxID=279826 RepID=A0A4R2BGI0_9BACI|nr:DUF1450 domain-containing protein [Mesobacillus foraminis]TCN25014.1 uncharacterized protein YuzB (UPF0349 family) [Mesobacillus foraminis]